MILETVSTIFSEKQGLSLSPHTFALATTTTTINVSSYILTPLLFYAATDAAIKLDISSSDVAKTNSALVIAALVMTVCLQPTTDLIGGWNEARPEINVDSMSDGPLSHNRHTVLTAVFYYRLMAWRIV